MESGYAHPAYASALEEFGHARELIHSGGWILERGIPGTEARDAMGCYPLFACRDWSALKHDLTIIGEDLVSLVIVADPFGEFSDNLLRDTFDDVVIPFKEHFVVDLTQRPESFVHDHHRRNARKALRDLTVDEPSDLAECIEEWDALYAQLVQRHGIKGIARFSRKSFLQQFKVPGINVFRARQGGQTVGMSLWYLREAIAYYHSAAYSDSGYSLGASFGLFWRAFEKFAHSDVRWIDLGSSAGVSVAAGDGLARFKSGWSNATRLTYLCGKIFDKAKYYELTEAKGSGGTRYFPAYRDGEFV
jgi:Acetyltransferase (GNAT) domain